MTILKPGLISRDGFALTGECLTCGCEVECEVSEIRLVTKWIENESRFSKQYYTINCPTDGCRSSITLSPATARNAG